MLMEREAGSAGTMAPRDWPFLSGALRDDSRITVLVHSPENHGD